MPTMPHEPVPSRLGPWSDAVGHLDVFGEDTIHMLVETRLCP